MLILLTNKLARTSEVIRNKRDEKLWVRQAIIIVLRNKTLAQAETKDLYDHEFIFGIIKANIGVLTFVS